MNSTREIKPYVKGGGEDNYSMRVLMSGRSLDNLS